MRVYDNISLEHLDLDNNVSFWQINCDFITQEFIKPKTGEGENQMKEIELKLDTRINGLYYLFISQNYRDCKKMFSLFKV